MTASTEERAAWVAFAAAALASGSQRGMAIVAADALLDEYRQRFATTGAEVDAAAGVEPAKGDGIRLLVDGTHVTLAELLAQKNARDLWGSSIVNRVRALAVGQSITVGGDGPWASVRITRQP